jgi:hypothetical protein
LLGTAVVENTDTLSKPAFTTASSPPTGLNASDSPAPISVWNGDPGSWVNAPVVWLMENTETPSPPLATASSPPVGLNASEPVSDPIAIGNGEPCTWVSAPVPGSTENTDTVWS